MDRDSQTYTLLNVDTRIGLLRKRQKETDRQTELKENETETEGQVDSD